MNSRVNVSNVRQSDIMFLIEENYGETREGFSKEHFTLIVTEERRHGFVIRKTDGKKIKEW